MIGSATYTQPTKHAHATSDRCRPMAALASGEHLMLEYVDQATQSLQALELDEDWPQSIVQHSTQRIHQQRESCPIRVRLGKEVVIQLMLHLADLCGGA